MTTAEGIYSVRRYYLLKRFAARDALDGGLESAWRAKQEEMGGTALAAAFPYRTRLVAAGYSTVEDLTGATSDELLQRASLSRREADAALAALESST